MRMKAVRVLLVDTTDKYKKLLEKGQQTADSIKLSITHAGARNAEPLFRESRGEFDIVLLGDKLASSSVVQMARVFRSLNAVIPIFLLTSQVSAQLPQSYRKSGVDDVMDAREIDSPLFTWTFISTVEHTALRKKAQEYDLLNNRLRSVDDSLSTVIHEINNPLSVIRLALYHLSNPDLSKSKRETFLKFLQDNIDRVDSHMKELRLIRRQLGGETATRAKIISIKASHIKSAAQR
jgi:signal transduction histidine kinase